MGYASQCGGVGIELLFKGNANVGCPMETLEADDVASVSHTFSRGGHSILLLVNLIGS